MNSTNREFVDELRQVLRHRLRPMTGLSGDEERASTPLELLYDLTYVIAFAKAAELLARSLADGSWAPGLGAYALAVFLVTWAWLSFTWFSSAYANDDALFRIATLVQMVGVIVLTFGLPAAFTAIADGRNPVNGLVIAGYVVMRIPLIALWLRAARDDREHRRTAHAYAAFNACAQVGWILLAILPLRLAAVAVILGAFAALELVIPDLVERHFGRPPWNARHIGERFGLLALITLGEVIAATASTVETTVDEDGWSPLAVVIIAAGIVLAAALWWMY